VRQLLKEVSASIYIVSARCGTLSLLQSWLADCMLRCFARGFVLNLLVFFGLVCVRVAIVWQHLKGVLASIYIVSDRCGMLSLLRSSRPQIACTAAAAADPSPILLIFLGLVRVCAGILCGISEQGFRQAYLSSRTVVVWFPFSDPQHGRFRAALFCCWIGADFSRFLGFGACLCSISCGHL
jgi:hypothetical protein